MDAHAHLGLLPRFRFEARTTEDILAACDALGIGRLVVAHHRDLTYGPTAGRDELVRAWEQSGGRVYAYCVLDPRRPGARRECERLLANPPYVGIKIHPVFHATPADDPAYEQAFALAQETGVPLMSHTWYRSTYNPAQALSFPDRFRCHLDRFPEVRFILGHGGGGADGLRAAVGLLRDYRNVYADLAGDVYEAGMVRSLVEAAGPERVLFASDLPWLDPRPQLGCVLAAGLPPDALRLVLGENAVRLFGLSEMA